MTEGHHHGDVSWRSIEIPAPKTPNTQKKNDFQFYQKRMLFAVGALAISALWHLTCAFQFFTKPENLKPEQKVVNQNSENINSEWKLEYFHYEIRSDFDL